MGFDSDTALRPAGDGVWEGELVPGWETPRGPLGGYVMAIALRAMELAVADPERQARSATMHFLRVPEDGPVVARAVVERAGRSLSSVSARLEQGGEPVGLAIGAYSKPWEGPHLNESPMPEAAPPDSPGAPQESMRNAPPPPFMGRMVMQHRFGPPPFTGAGRAEVGGWIGIGEDRPIDALAIAVLADAWFPAPWPRLTALAPAPTIDLTVHFRSALPVTTASSSSSSSRPGAHADLLLGRFRTRLVRDGFFEEDGELWSPDGTLVAQSRQLGLLIGAEAPD